MKKKSERFESLMPLLWNKKCFKMMHLMFFLIMTGIMQISANPYITFRATNLYLTSSQQQQITTVTGIVRDNQTSEVMPGVNISVKGTTVGTSTDANGKYSLNVSDENAVLVFSFIGYSTKEVMVRGKSVIDIALVSELKDLDEVVVIGYGTRKKSDLTGAMSNLKTDDFARQISATFDQLIQGKVPGVHVVTNSGAPGGGLSVSIRGASSISSSSEPLYVIDGVPIFNEIVAANAAQGIFPEQRAPRNPLSSINPSDIASIDILKDASATAIYGARGANGVVMITTKRGVPGKLTVNFESYAGVQNVNTRLDLLTAEEYMSELNEIVDAGGAEASERVTSIIDGGTDWQDQIYRENALISNTNLSFSAGSENTSYLVTLNYFDQEGVIVSSNFKRYAARFNLNHDIKDKFKLGLSLSTSYIIDDYAPVGQDINERSGCVGSAINYDPTQAIKDDEGNYIHSSYIMIDNPLTIAYGYTSDKNTFRTLGSIYGEYFILPELSARINLGTDISNSKRNFYADRTTTEGFSMGGNASVIESNLLNYLMEGTINYNKGFGNHSFNIVTGVTLQEFIRDDLEVQASGFPTDITRTDNMGLGNPERFITGSDKMRSSLLSYLARVNYTLLDRYLVTMSIRADGSSKFGENNKYGYFPSIALGWKMHEERFFEPLKNTISLLKIRASWGRTGNQEIGSYKSITTFTSTNRDAVPFDETWSITMRPSRMGNPDLKWETTEQINLGFDFGLFEQRISGTFDYFRKTTYDMLMDIPVPNESGFTVQMRNIGSVFNTGAELGLDANILTGEFKWRANISLATVRNEVLDLGGIPMILTGSAQTTDPMGLITVGEPMYSFYGYDIVGIWQEDDDYDATFDNVNPGDFKFRDVNQDSTVNASDRVILGNSYPDLMWSFGNTFSYKNFELYIFFDGEQGMKMYNSKLGDTYFPVEFRRNRLAEPILNRWTPENPSTIYPSQIDPFSQGTKQINPYTVEDASYMRLNTAQLSYNFNFRTKAIRSATLYLSGQNLLVLTKYTGMSPIVNSQGTTNLRIDYDQYPLPRTIIIGIKLGL